jgi:hypothetical protein
MKYVTNFIEGYKGSFNPKVVKAELVLLKHGFDLKIQYVYGDVQVIPFYNQTLPSSTKTLG